MCAVSRAGLPLVANDLRVHPALDHAEEHRLYGAVQLVVLRAQIRGTDVGQDGFTNA